MDQERYIRAREVGEQLGLSAETILRHYRDGLIPGRRLPGTIRPVRFLWSEVEAAWSELAERAAQEAREEWAGRLPRLPRRVA